MSCQKDCEVLWRNCIKGVKKKKKSSKVPEMTAHFDHVMASFKRQKAPKNTFIQN